MAGTTLVGRGLGWWFRRRRPHWFPIFDHAIDACGNPARFGLRAAPLRRLVAAHGGDPVLETVRDAVIPWLCRQGYIRVRWSGDRLGWQFHGDPDGSLAVLRRFVRRQELGGAIIVTFTDFADPAASRQCDLRRLLRSC